MAERIEIIVDGRAQDWSRAANAAERDARSLGRTVRQENAQTAASTQKVTKATNTYRDAQGRLRTENGRFAADQDRVRASTDRLGVSIGGVNRNFQFLRNAMRVIKWPALIAAAGAATQGIAALAAAAVALTSALAPLAGTLAVIPGALGAIVQGVGTAALALNGIGEVLSAMADQQAKAGESATQMADQQQAAAERVRGAVEQVHSAESSLATAQRGVKLAQEQLTQARFDATRQLKDMRLANEGAALSEERALMSLEEARNALRAAERDPKTSRLEIRNLALGVEEAEHAVREARVESTRSQDDLNRAEREGIARAPEVIDARRGLADAERQVVAAQRQVAGANRDVRVAQREANEAMASGAAGADALAQKMAALPPAAQAFARQLFAMKPMLDELRQTAAAGLLPGLGRGIEQATRNFPALERVVGATATRMGELSEQAGRFLGRKGFGRDFELIGNRNVRLLGDWAQVSFNLADALRHITIAAGPLLRWMSRSLVSFSALIEREAEAGRETGRLAAFFEDTRDTIERVVSIGQSMAATFLAIGRAARPLGDSILKALDDGAESLERWAESTSGQNSLRQFFADAKPAIFEAGRLIGDMTKGFFKLADTRGLAPLIRQVRTELLPALIQMTRVATKNFGPVLIDLLGQASTLFRSLVAGDGGLTLLVKGLSSALDVVNKLIDVVPQLGTVLSVAFVARGLGRLSGGRLSGGLFGKGRGAAGAAAAGAAGGTTVLGGLAGGGLKQKAFGLGKQLIGVNLALGAIAGFTSEAPKFAGKLQDVVSQLTFGLTPSWQEQASEDAKAYGRALEKGFKSEDFAKFLSHIDLTGGAGVSKAGRRAARQVAKDLEGGLLPALRNFSIGTKRAERATDVWREALKKARDEGEISVETYDSLSRALDKTFRHFEKGKPKIQALRDEFQIMRDRVFHNLGDIRKASEHNMAVIGRVLPAGSKLAKQLVAANFDAMADAIERSMELGLISTRKGTKALERILHRQLKNFGIKDVQGFINRQDAALDANRGPGSSPMGQQRGGHINMGAPTGDTVPALLERDEYVLNRKAVKAIGLDTLDAINFGAAKRFAVGGAADFGGHPSNVNTGVAKLIATMQSRFPLVVTSTTDGNHTAGSDHYSGDAVDMGSASQTVMDNAAAYVMRSGIFKQLKQGIHNPNLSVNAGAVVPTSFWDPATWAGHVNHLHLAVAGALSGAFGAAAKAAVEKIVMPRFTSDFELGAVGAAGLNNVARGVEVSMNRRLAALNPGVGAGVAGGVYHGPLDREFPHPTSLANPGQAISQRDSTMLARRAGFGSGDTRRSPAAQDLIVNRESGRHPGIVGDDAAAGFGNTFGLGLNQITRGVQSGPTNAAFDAIGHWANPWDNYQMAYFLDTNSTGDPWAASAQKGGLIGRMVAKMQKGGIAGLQNRISGLFGDLTGAKGDERKDIQRQIERLQGKLDKAQTRRQRHRTDKITQGGILAGRKADVAGRQHTVDVLNDRLGSLETVHGLTDMRDVTQLLRDMGLDPDTELAALSPEQQGILTGLANSDFNREQTELGIQTTTQKDALGALLSLRESLLVGIETAKLQAAAAQKAADEAARKEKKANDQAREHKRKIERLRHKLRNLRDDKPPKRGPHEKGRDFRRRRDQWERRQRRKERDLGDRIGHQQFKRGEALKRAGLMHAIGVAESDRHDQLLGSEGLGAFMESLEGVQGVGRTMQPGLGVAPLGTGVPRFGGQILEAQANLARLGATDIVKPTFDFSGETQDEARRAELEHQRRLEETARANISEASFGAISAFLEGLPQLPFLGAFAHGIERIPRDGMARVHKGETINPAPEGPFVNMAARAEPANVTLVLGDRTGELVELIDARVDGRAARITTTIDRSIGRSRRQRATAPGGR